VDFDLAEAVDGAIEIASLRAKEKQIAIVTEIAPDVPQKLSGDPDRLRQVLINLLANAVKFTPKGTVQVRIGRDSANGEPGALRFAISDEGIGIPPAKLEEIFEAFAQADASTTRKYGGTGLGLAISKRLVELMGGHIWAESRPGAAGSTFYFTARFGAAEGISMRAGAAFEMPRGGNATPHGIAPALRILVVDDSEDNRYLMAEYLKDLGAQVDFADNGETALEKFRSCEYDVVLMDLQMPVMDGWEATSQVRQWEKEHRTRVVPVIVLTASALDTEAQRALDAGCTAFLRKPVRLVTLLDAIRKYTVRDTASGESPSPNRITIVADARIRPLIPGYLENRRKDVDAVLAALERNDYSTIRALGHKMSGTGGGYGFQRITDIGSELEKAAKQQNGADVRRQASELQTFLEQLDVLYP
jgi:CheY-like chemotaxis protein/HPt (histidine-containing phosphotransfer) domain-containing protein